MKITQSIVEMDISPDAVGDVLITCNKASPNSKGNYQFDFIAPESRNKEKLLITVYPDTEEVSLYIFHWDTYMEGIILNFEQAKTLMACLAHILEKVEHA